MTQPTPLTPVWRPPVMPVATPVTTPVATTPSTPVATTTTGNTPTPPAPDITTLPGSWQVEPSQVSSFTAAVQQVRGDLEAVVQQALQLTSSSYQPALGTSPTGQALTAKFCDRLAGEGGLLSNLDAVLTHLDQFVSNAEQSASLYTQTDSSAADSLKTT